MADFGIKPDIVLGVKGPQPQSLADLLGTATKAMEFSRLSELYPELIKKTTAEAAAAKTGAEKAAMGFNLDKAKTITDGQVSMMFNPLVVAAAQGKPVDKTALLEAVTNNAKVQSQNAGIDWETQGKQLAAPYIERAMNNPAELQGYIKERMIAGLDQATRASMMTPSPISGLPAPATFAPAEGVARPLGIQGQAPAPQTIPQAAPAGQPPAAPRGVTPPDMTAPIRQQAAPQGAGFPIRFPVRQAGDIRPFAPGEETARALGERTRSTLLEAQAEVPRGNRSVGEIIRIADELAKDVRFQTGGAADIERALRQNLGDARYKELAKDIAQVQMAVNKANNANTDQQTAQVAAGYGDATYPPDVLIKISRRLRGELTEIDARARGAQEFVRRFGDANLADFQQAWSQNSDLRNFEVMAILRDVRDPAAQKAALDKILPNNQEELRELQRKYQAIEKLTRTGTLR